MPPGKRRFVEAVFLAATLQIASWKLLQCWMVVAVLGNCWDDCSQGKGKLDMVSLFGRLASWPDKSRSLMGASLRETASTSLVPSASTTTLP